MIGIGISKGEQLTNVGNPDDQMIVIPYTTAMRWLQRTDAVAEFMISPRVRERGAESIRQVRELTGLHREFDPELWRLATNAEALAPQWLRTSLRDRAAALAARYDVSS